jgi:hypothetical protein
MLLEKLNLTRECDDMLISEHDPVSSSIVERLSNGRKSVIWTGIDSVFGIPDDLILVSNNNIIDDDDMDVVNNISVQTRYRFAPNQFACNIMWYCWFFIHPRLRPTNRLLSGGQSFNQLVHGLIR